MISLMLWTHTHHPPDPHFITCYTHTHTILLTHISSLVTHTHTILLTHISSLVTHTPSSCPTFYHLLHTHIFSVTNYLVHAIFITIWSQHQQLYVAGPPHSALHHESQSEWITWDCRTVVSTLVCQSLSQSLNSHSNIWFTNCHLVILKYSINLYFSIIDVTLMPVEIDGT